MKKRPADFNAAYTPLQFILLTPCSTDPRTDHRLDQKEREPGLSGAGLSITYLSKNSVNADNFVKMKEIKVFQNTKSFTSFVQQYLNKHQTKPYPNYPAI